MLSSPYLISRGAGAPFAPLVPPPMLTPNHQKTAERGRLYIIMAAVTHISVLVSALRNSYSVSVESPQHAVANLMCVECGKLVACTDECVYTWLYPLGIAMINESFCLSGSVQFLRMSLLSVVHHCRKQ